MLLPLETCTTFVKQETLVIDSKVYMLEATKHDRKEAAVEFNSILSVIKENYIFKGGNRG